MRPRRESPRGWTIGLLAAALAAGIGARAALLGAGGWRIEVRGAEAAGPGTSPEPAPWSLPGPPSPLLRPRSWLPRADGPGRLESPLSPSLFGPAPGAARTELGGAREQRKSDRRLFLPPSLLVPSLDDPADSLGIDPNRAALAAIRAAAAGAPAAGDSAPQLGWPDEPGEEDSPEPAPAPDDGPHFAPPGPPVVLALGVGALRR